MADSNGNPSELTLRRVLVIGTGLMGTSLALALREAGIETRLHDIAVGRLALAVERGAGVPHDEDLDGGYDIAVLAIPPDAVAGELLRYQRLGVARSFTDVASVKSKPLAEAEKIGADMTTFVGGHPIAGRERSGPAAAHPDLFVGRPWVITPTPAAGEEAIAAVRALAVAAGATPVVMTAEEHDAALALVSHLPHLLASVLAAQLVDAPRDFTALAGTGLQDVTRIAAGDPQLWTEILAANADHLLGYLERFQQRLQDAAAYVARIARGDAAATTALTELLRTGVQGRLRVPVKRGEPAAGFATVAVTIRDAPGELAALLRALAEAGINVEDVRVEHEPGRPVGVVELDVREDKAQALIRCVRDAGWQLYV
ncbi:prephenate dehydrogenase [Acidothermus cellulolyticus 11B]|uniref:Prephenate dehydrogenase n=1 Tax=Acidothermus cellulolyticus (strain ATCC 43068 / DSM 8971 / 11B) TaxID=351607 RepID=A0LU97_ACIC1|nr:prephenate dehydrogenase [Acidothermus cellulolyticus]ABK53007.1 prephenate dehydrogenase [Acidothermus cellulolyticus 11B]